MHKVTRVLDENVKDPIIRTHTHSSRRSIASINHWVVLTLAWRIDFMNIVSGAFASTIILCQKWRFLQGL